MNKTVGIILAVLVLVVGAYGAYRVVKHYSRINSPTTLQPTTTTSPTTSTPQASSSAQSAMTVTITSAGFNPQIITIKVGDSVTWTNNDTVMHNVSSAPHPTHTAYPPLNLGNIAPGSSKSLTFPLAGTFKYHDHLNPTLTGQVVVQ